MDAGGLATSALKVLPFFRLAPQSESEQNALYFYSSRDTGGALRYVSYHFEGSPEMPLEDESLSELLDGLLPRD